MQLNCRFMHPTTFALPPPRHTTSAPHKHLVGCLTHSGHRSFNVTAHRHWWCHLIADQSTCKQTSKALFQEIMPAQQHIQLLHKEIIQQKAQSHMLQQQQKKQISNSQRNVHLQAILFWCILALCVTWSYKNKHLVVCNNGNGMY